MDEKRLVEVMEPFADELVSLSKRIDELKLQKGDPGEPGAPGKDAAAVDVADRLKADNEFLEFVKGEPGAPGLPGSPGKDGENGKDADPAEVAERIKADASLLASLRGAPGENGSDGIGIKAVSVSEDRKSFSLLLDDDQEVIIELPQPERGEKGEKGLDGLGIETKAWQPGVYREGTFVSCNIGQTFKAIRDTAAAPGTDDWERVGKGGFRWAGLKHADKEYQDGDLYIDGGSTFLWWNGKGNMFAQRGAPGKPGEPGKPGKDGADAPVIVAVKYTPTGVFCAMSNGDMVEAEVEGFQDTVKALSDASVQYWLDANAAKIQQEGGTPVRAFQGTYVFGKSYTAGDMVVYNRSLWIAKSDTSGATFEAAAWRQMFGVGGGGSVGGSATIPDSVRKELDKLLEMDKQISDSLGDLSTLNVYGSASTWMHDIERRLALLEAGGTAPTVTSEGDLLVDKYSGSFFRVRFSASDNPTLNLWDGAEHVVQFTLATTDANGGVAIPDWTAAGAISGAVWVDRDGNLGKMTGANGADILPSSVAEWGAAGDFITLKSVDVNGKTNLVVTGIHHAVSP